MDHSDEGADLRKWMETRFDRLDDKIDDKTEKLQDELIITRHGIKPLIEQLTIQMVSNIAETKTNSKNIGEINEWRAPDGPLDHRFTKVSDRIEDGEIWRHTMRGALIAVSFFVPIITGIVVAAVVTVLTHALG